MYEYDFVKIPDVILIIYCLIIQATNFNLSITSLIPNFIIFLKKM
jgi:hypothetical protein